MSRAYNTRTFLIAARKVHGDRFAYSNLVYHKSRLPVTITCRIHGDFEQRPSAHLSGHGCRQCANAGVKQRMEGNQHRVQNGNRAVHLSLTKQQAVDLLAWLVSVPTDQDDPQVVDTLIAKVNKAAKS